MDLPGIVTVQNRALVLKMVCQSTMKAEAFGYPFIMAALVLQFFGSGEVYQGRAIIAAVGAGGVAHHVGGRRGCLGGGQVGIVRVVREVGMGLDSVIEFHI
jgi:hypothetical protein